MLIWLIIARVCIGLDCTHVIAVCQSLKLVSYSRNHCIYCTIELVTLIVQSRMGCLSADGFSIMPFLILTLLFTYYGI